LPKFRAKDIDKDLDDKETQKQTARYVDGLGNVLLTDYLEFRWYLNDSKKPVHTVVLAEIKAKKIIPIDGRDESLVSLLKEFITTEDARTVKSAKELAKRMANLAKIIREIILNALNLPESTQLHETMKSFADVLIHDMSEDQFADMYAQTISYGMFAARVNHNIGKSKFERMTAGYDLPKTNPFLRQLFNTIAGPDLDESITWAVDELANLLHHADMEGILKDFGKRTRQEDPVVHFYETFLAAYDPKLRESRGVYYTPEPMVSYFVRSVDHILKTEFGLEKGLADATKINNIAPPFQGGVGVVDSGKEKTPAQPPPNSRLEKAGDLHKVLILDPACGTGTFLHGVIDQIHENFKGNEGAWDSYVSEHLLSRIFGFELLMAPYAIAHLKLGLQLKEFGYKFGSDERLRVYLTNTLEEAFHADEKLPLTNWLAKEANAANEVKRDLPIMVVLGNPPYSNFGMMNKGKWIKNLLQEYKEGLNEKKINLDDDFIKFIRFAHWRIERTGSGILAFISNNTYIDGITHRRMRQELLKTFDRIYIVNLHGSTNKKETTSDGFIDENVFDIRQGVAIGIFVKLPGGLSEGKKILYKDIRGNRKTKYEILLSHDISNTKFTQVKPSNENFFFYPTEENLTEEYSSFTSLSLIIKEYISGVQTKKDDLFVDFKTEDLKGKIKKLFDKDKRESDQEIMRMLSESQWILKKLKNKAFEPAFIHSYIVSPFDSRYVYYDVDLLGRARFKVMHSMLVKNIGLVFMRQVKSGSDYDCFLVTDTLITDRVFYSAHGAPFLFPLYLYPYTSKKDLFSDEGYAGETPVVRTPNFSAEFIAEIEKKLDLKFRGEVDPEKQQFSKVGHPHYLLPEDIFHYMYAIFHSPTYRTRYAEFLKIDFPRLPLTSDRVLFFTLCKLGEELVKLHLMERTVGVSPASSYPRAAKIAAVQAPNVKFPKKGSNEVEFVKYVPPASSPAPLAGKMPAVQINSEQYFEGVPEDVWNFHIGGYQVAHKWLKDRKGRKLSYDDIEHYGRIIVAIGETIRIMKEVDEVIKGAGGFPLK
jgi:predicted helicase